MFNWSKNKRMIELAESLKGKKILGSEVVEFRDKFRDKCVLRLKVEDTSGVFRIVEVGVIGNLYETAWFEFISTKE